jgi:hypothetical protein
MNGTGRRRPRGIFDVERQLNVVFDRIVEPFETDHNVAGIDVELLSDAGGGDVAGHVVDVNVAGNFRRFGRRRFLFLLRRLRHLGDVGCPLRVDVNVRQVEVVDVRASQSQLAEAAADGLREGQLRAHARCLQD